MSETRFTPELESAIEEYKKIFNDDAPVDFMHGSPEDKVERIKKCLADGEPVPLSEYEEVMNQYIRRERA